MIKSLAIGDCNLATVSSPEVRRWGWKFRPSDHLISFSGDQPPSCVSLKSSQQYTKDTYHSGNSKSFMGSVLGTRDKDQIHIFIHTHLYFPTELPSRPLGPKDK